VGETTTLETKFLRLILRVCWDGRENFEAEKEKERDVNLSHDVKVWFFDNYFLFFRRIVSSIN
jgi:hypothetical protein